MEDRDASIPRLHGVVAALPNIKRCREDKYDMVAHMPSKVKRHYEQRRLRVVSLRVVEVSELREKIDKVTDDVEAKDLVHQRIPGLIAETSMLLEETIKIREVAKKGEANVAVLGDLQEEVWP